jgi:GNAT superfamily N-acetyltransferase
LEGEVRHDLDEVVDPSTGMVRADRKYSAHRDTVVNRCNAFGNSMVALLAMTLMDLAWDVPDASRPLALAPQAILMDEEAHMRRGLGRAMLTEGLDRLVARGMARLKVGFETDAAQALYASAGFQTRWALRTFATEVQAATLATSRRLS